MPFCCKGIDDDPYHSGTRPDAAETIERLMPGLNPARLFGRNVLAHQPVLAG